MKFFNFNSNRKRPAQNIDRFYTTNAIDIFLFLNKYLMLLFHTIKQKFNKIISNLTLKDGI